MKFRLVMAFALMTVGSVWAEDWKLPEVMGRKYWTILEDVGIKGLPDRAVFKDYARYFGIANPPLPEGFAAFSKIADNFHGGEKNQLYRLMEDDKTALDKPLLLYLSAKRRSFPSLLNKLELDMDDYSAFKARHPNFFAFSVLDEWGNDLWGWETMRRDNLSEDVVRHFFGFPKTKDGVLEMHRNYAKRMKELNYGDERHCSACRGLYCIDHLAATLGASFLMLETTNTSFGDEENRWDLQAAWTRGASRQFGNIPWNWFVAIYYIGFTRAGEYVPDSVCQCNPFRGPSSKNGGPKGGVSPSLFNRICYYAYLNGATMVQTEQWFDHLLTTNAVGKLALSDRGEMFARFHDFTVAHPDRGVPYAPVAILTPLNQGYMSWGGYPWRRPKYLGYTPADNNVDGVFFSIVPGFRRWDAVKRGEEGCLHNTPMAMMYDVLVPDSPQPAEEFDKVLANYKAAIVAGEYSDAGIAKMKPSLERFVENGGKLAMPKATARRMFGERVPDHVYVSETEWMTPEMGDGAKAVAETLNGTRKFPETKRVLRYFQKRFFPFKVDGECLFGANKTEKGWWFWALNNKGVTKFADEFQQVDETQSSPICVTLPEGCGKVRELLTGQDLAVKDGCFTYRIPAGGVSIFEVAEGQ